MRTRHGLWIGAVLLAGCSSTASDSHPAAAMEVSGPDGAVIFQAAEDAMRAQAQIEMSDARGRVLKGHMGPYAVKIVVPPDVSRAEIRCDREGEWSAGAIRRRTEGEPAPVSTSGQQLTAESCVRDLQNAIESRL